MGYIVTDATTSQQTRCPAEQLAGVIAGVVERTSAGVSFAISELVRKIEHKEPIDVEEKFLGVRVERASDSDQSTRLAGAK